jgi:3'-phosphoadenosine 5'-phosphosulfate sulfotransferase (PAPS reductase)/FAD synthetase
VRKYFQAQNPTIELQVFGMSAEEKHRAERLLSDGNNYAFPLIDANYTKADCYQILGAERIELPVMYKLGFNNNNCIGCVKGGKGYWNMIKKHFPDYFNKMAALEREIGRSCIKNKFLDELLPTEGDHKEPDIECGLFCNAGVWQ